MTSKVILFSEFMEEQREKYHIPDYGLSSRADFYQMAMAYSELDRPSPVRPNYYVAMYYIARYLTTELSDEATVRVFSTTAEEQQEYEEAYRVFAAGRNFYEADQKMEPLVRKNHLEAIALYPVIHSQRYGNVDWRTYDEMAVKLSDPVQTAHVPSLLAMGFEQNPRALWRLLDRAVEDAGLARIILKWQELIYVNQISRNPHDGYAMTKLADIYRKDALRDEASERYWNLQAVETGYGPAVFDEAMRIEMRECHENFGIASFEQIDLAIHYLRDAQSCGIAGCKDWIKTIKKERKMEEQYHRNMASYSSSNSRIEAQMQEYRDKLDRRETMLNFLTEGTPWTNKDSEIYGWMTQDYDRFSTDLMRSLVRERREEEYRQKLLRESVNVVHSEMAQQDAARSLDRAKRRQEEQRQLNAVQPTQARVIAAPSSVRSLPVEPALLEDEEFKLLYQKCNVCRQMRDFREAEVTAQEMVRRYPDSHMARWLHFLAAHGIVFCGGLEVFHIGQLSEKSYMEEEDCQWIVQHAGAEAGTVYALYFQMFESARKRYLEMGKKTADTEVVLVCQKEDADGDETFASGIVHSLQKKGWGDMHVYSPSDQDFTSEPCDGEAYTYAALRNARVMVLVADVEDDLYHSEMMQQWTRYRRWVKTDSGKQIVAVSLGALSRDFQSITENIYSLANTEDVDQVYRGITDLLAQQWMKARNRTSSQAVTAFAAKHCPANEELGAPVLSTSYIKKVMTREMHAQTDYFGDEDGDGIIHLSSVTHISCAVVLQRAIGTAKTIRMQMQVYDMQGVQVCWLYHDIDVRADNDRFAAGWNFHVDANDYMMKPGMYRLRMWIDDSDYAECFFGVLE
ncbi:MAG: hypothetical protein LIO96_02230 [Lachnospiraceae bacterium]|nr:hypothetical protein [Lachnospiraceae bacterium]